MIRRAFESVYTAVSDIRFIVSAKYKTSEKQRLLFDYLRLSVKKAVHRHFQFTRERFLSYTVNVADYHDFYGMFREIFVRKAYYFETVNPEPYIVDCGGNIGMSVLFFKHMYPNARVLVFEPSPISADYLRRNIRENNLKNVEIVTAALSNMEGHATLFASAKRPGGGGATTSENVARSKGADQTWRTTSVPMVRLSTHMKMPVDLLKLDIEGSEGSVFDDLEREARLKLVKEAVFEYHHNAENQANSLSRIATILERNKFGFVVFQDEVDTPDLPGRNRKPYHFMIRAYQA